MRAVGSFCAAGLFVLAVQSVPLRLHDASEQKQSHLDKQDVCACLVWQKVYASGMARCGQGLEYYFVTKKGTPWANASRALGGEFCGKFFTRIPDNFCVNADQTDARGAWNSRQWCYVSSKCQELSGGKPVSGTNVSWKLCAEAEGDELLRTKIPFELDDLRGSRDLALGLLAKYAYPVWQKDSWPAVERFFLGHNRTAYLTKSGRKDLKQVASSGEPMLFNSESGHPPFHVVAGSRVFKIDFTPNGHANFAAGRMGSVTSLKCIQDCAPPRGAAAAAPPKGAAASAKSP